MKQTAHITKMIGWMLGCVILVALVFLFAPRFSGNLIFLAILLVCILVHVFMMKGHGGHGGDSRRDRPEDNQHNH